MLCSDFRPSIWIFVNPKSSHIKGEPGQQRPLEPETPSTWYNLLHFVTSEWEAPQKENCPRKELSSSVDKPPEPHPGKPERDAHDAQLTASHAEHGLALEDLCSLLLELRLAGNVTIRSQAEEGTATYRTD